MRVPTRAGALISWLLALSAGCSFPDPTFVDAAGGAASTAGAGLNDAGTSGSTSGTTAGGTCGNGCEPQLLAEGQGEVIAIAAYEADVYWITKLEAENSAELRSVSAMGGDVAIIGSEGLGSSANFLAVDRSSAFVANQSSGGLLVSLRLSDGVLAWDFMQEWIDTIFLTSSNIYYSSPYALVKLPKTGPGDGGRVDLTMTGGPRLLLLDEDDLLVLDQSEMREPPRRVVRLRADGSQPFAEATVVLDAAPDFDSAAADGEAYYFTDADEGEIVRLPRANPSSAEPLAQDEAIPRRLQLWAGSLYWTTDSGSELRSMPVSGGAPASVDQAVTQVVATSTSGVFWATEGGLIRRLGP